MGVSMHSGEIQRRTSNALSDLKQTERAPLWKQFAVPEQLREQYGGPTVEMGLISTRKIQFGNITWEIDRRIDAETVQALFDRLIAFHTWASAHMTPTQNAVQGSSIKRILVAERSPYWLQPYGPNAVVVNRGILSLFQWLALRRSPPVAIQQLPESRPRDYSPRLPWGDLKGSMTGTPIWLRDVAESFDALMTPLWVSLLVSDIPMARYPPMADQWLAHNSLPSWRIKEGEGPGRVAYELRALWEIIGAFFTDELWVERFYIPCRILHEYRLDTYRKENNTISYNEGVQSVFNEALGCYPTRHDLLLAWTDKRRQGRQFLLSQPTFADLYLDHGAESFVNLPPGRVETIPAQWQDAYTTISRLRGEIDALFWLSLPDEEDDKGLGHPGDQPYYPHLSVRSWRPSDQLLINHRRDPTVLRLQHMFFLIGISRWGLLPAFSERGQSLYNQVRLPRDHGEGEVDTWAILPILNTLWGDANVKKAWHSLARHDPEFDRASLPVQLERLFTHLMRRSPPTQEHVNTFWKALYAAYPRSLIHEAVLGSFFEHRTLEGILLNTFRSVAYWCGLDRQRPPGHQLWIGDSHELFATWVGDVNLRHEIESLGYPLPSFGTVFERDGALDISRYNGMLAVNFLPIYFDLESMKAIWAVDEKLFHAIVDFVVERSSVEGTLQNYDEQNKRTHTPYHAPVNYGHLIRVHFPELFEWIVEHRPDFADIRDLSAHRRYTVRYLPFEVKSPDGPWVKPVRIAFELFTLDANGVPQFTPLSLNGAA